MKASLLLFDEPAVAKIAFNLNYAISPLNSKLDLLIIMLAFTVYTEACNIYCRYINEESVVVTKCFIYKP